MPIENTFIIHALGVPLIFATISLICFKKFSYTAPWQTAIGFVFFATRMDFFLVAIFIQKSFELFTSILGSFLL